MTTLQAICVILIIAGLGIASYGLNLWLSERRGAQKRLGALEEWAAAVSAITDEQPTEAPPATSEQIWTDQEREHLRIAIVREQERQISQALERIKAKQRKPKRPATKKRTKKSGRVRVKAKG